MKRLGFKTKAQKAEKARLKGQGSRALSNAPSTTSDISLVEDEELSVEPEENEEPEEERDFFDDQSFANAQACFSALWTQACFKAVTAYNVLADRRHMPGPVHDWLCAQMRGPRKWGGRGHGGAHAHRRQHLQQRCALPGAC